MHVLLYYVLLEKTETNTRDLFLNVYIIPSVIIMIFLRKFILHREYYSHHIITILLISLISIVLTSLNLIMYETFNTSKENFQYILISSILFVFVTLMYILYKYLYEYYYINMHLFNAIEGGLISIYTFIFYFVKNNRDEKNFEMFDHFGKFILACFANLIINTLIKYIVYVYNEMYALIPMYIVIYNIIDYVGKERVSDINKSLKYFLFIIQLVLYVLLILCVCVFFEIIIIHKWDC